MTLLDAPTTTAVARHESAGAMARPLRELLLAAEQLRCHRERLAMPRLVALVQDKIDASTPNPTLLAHILAEALLQRLDREQLECRSVVVEHADVPQLALYYRLARVYPHMHVGHHVANRVLLRALRGARKVTIVDVGIGRGMQILRLLTTLRDEAPEITDITVVGIDPAAESLQHAAQTVERMMASSGLQGRFIAVCKALEALDASDCERITSHGGRLVVNAAYALHHTLHDPLRPALRTQLLANLHTLDPAAVVLVEPHVDHNVESLGARLYNTWQHVSRIYELIDLCTSVDDASRFSIKEMFLGRELREVFGASERFRRERRETYQRWSLHLTRAGFDPSPLDGLYVEPLKHGFSRVDDGLVRLGYRNATLIAVLAYRPRRQASQHSTASLTRAS